jgi:hypothetical protein
MHTNRDVLKLGDHSDSIFRCGNFGMMVLAALDKTKVDVRSTSAPHAKSTCRVYTMHMQSTDACAYWTDYFM